MPHKSKKRITPVVEEIVSDQEQQQHHVENPTPVDTHHQPVKPPPEVIDEALPPSVTENPVSTHSSPRFSINLGFVGIVLVVAGFVALLTGGLYVYFNGVSSFQGSSEPTPEAVSLATPMPSSPPQTSAAPSAKPTTAPKLTDFKLSVQNGSGKIGEAGKVKIALEKAGFKVTQTGNANAFNYTDTIIQAKSSVSSDVISKVKAALEGTYSTKDGDTLDAKNSFDIIVTVGSK